MSSHTIHHSITRTQSEVEIQAMLSLLSVPNIYHMRVFGLPSLPGLKVDDEGYVHTYIDCQILVYLETSTQIIQHGCSNLHIPAMRQIEQYKIKSVLPESR